MGIKFESKGGFDNALKWLNKVSNTRYLDAKEIAQHGTTSLSSATPKNTGETASGWVHDVTTNRNSLEIAWGNVAHPESKVNVAILIEMGHGTGTGGYVPPRPYIRQAMNPVWERLDDKLRELMK